MRRLRGCRSLAPQSQQRGVRSFSAESLTLVSPRITKIHCEDRSQDAILNLNWLQTFSLHILSILAASRSGQVLLVLESQRKCFRIIILQNIWVEYYY